VDTNISAQNLLILGGWLIVNYILFTGNVGETTVMFTAYVHLKSHLLNYLLMV
jgi:cytochrome c oxidase subunit 1